MKRVISTAGKLNTSQRGFTYLVVIAAAAIVGISAAVAVVPISRLVQVEKEEELLFIGQAYKKAIKSYYEVTPGLNKRYPMSLDDLLTDSRFPSGLRHIRRLYLDPMGKTGSLDDWLIIRGAGGGITGIASKSGQRPIKKANFPKGLESFNGAITYSDWVFSNINPLTL